MTHIAVIGAGITGVTTAFHLHQRGFDVTVLDRQRYAGMETSFANGGQLSASNAEVWNSWATVLKGIKWMAKADAPLLMSPKPSWHKISWMAEFMGNIPRYKSNTIRTVELALAARKSLFDMAALTDVDFNHEERGILHIYANAKDLKAAEKVNALYARGGLDRRAVTPEEIAEIEPALASDVLGGYFTPSDSTGDIHKLTFGVARWLERQGVTFQYGGPVRRVEKSDDAVTIETDQVQKFDGVVVCAGIGSREIARQFGDRVNIYPVKGYSITVMLEDAESQAAAPQVSLLDDAAKIVTSRLGADRFRVAGTAEFAGNNRDIRADRITPLVKWVEQYFPKVSTEHAVPWAGLRPMMPSMLPRVGQGRSNRVFYNTGHGHLGWTLSGATAEMVATDVAGVFRPTPTRKSGAAALA